MTKFSKQELISNYPNCTCINPKLNSNKPILCSESGMHSIEAKEHKPVSGIMQLVKMEKGILSGKRLMQIGIMQRGIMQRGIRQRGIMQIGTMRKGITQRGIMRKGITQRGVT